MFAVFCWVSVQFWREVWSGEIPKDRTESRALCSSSHWALCLCWVEFWVLTLTLDLSFLLELHVEELRIFNYQFFLNCRGFPVWLKYVPGISFRTDNEPFKVNFIYIPFIISSLHWLCCMTCLWRNYGASSLVVLQRAMQGFTEKIVGLMKSEKLFESQGGPIILSQVNVG